tara:strand:+ start:281573 stop:282361 length:789 start_codon:yes stop_codon:yes gene_type:complete
MNIKPLYFLILLLIASACGGSKSVTKTEVLSTKDVVNAHLASEPQFNTLASRVQVVYEDDSKVQSITASLRMEKDETIWIKASILGITLAKVLITPDRVSYYESISNTYFEGDFTLLSEWLGTDIDFQKAQDILLGQSIFNLSESGYTSSWVQGKYKLLPKKQQPNFIYSLLLYSNSFKIASETLSQPNEGRILTVRYGEYQNLDGNLFPSEINIETIEAAASPSEESKKTKIDLNYKKIDLNVSVSFPFTIPQGYEEIRLK